MSSETMTADRMLSQMGLSKEQFQDLHKKRAAFEKSLDEKQLAVMRASMLPLADAAATFGPDVDGATLEKVMREAAGGNLLMIMSNYGKVRASKKNDKE